MNKTDMNILEAINAVSTKSFVSPVKVNETLRMDTTKLGDHLKMLKNQDM